MTKILIVDDQTLNQTLIEAYINQYCRKSGSVVKIRKANDGLQAVSLCLEEAYDLIFMDVLMPNMNGIEATKRINSLQPKAVIIIVSTEGDVQNQIQALRNGAKDYFLKPIHPDVFKQRLELYLSMIDSAKREITPKRSHNPFTGAIYCYHTFYRIETEEDLAQLWESLMSTIKERVQTHLLSDLIRFMYQLGLAMLSRQVQPHIIVEENEHSFFFSILNVNILPSRKIIRLIDHYLNEADYRLNPNLLSFRVVKEAAPALVETAQVTPQEKPPPPPVETVYEKRAETLQRFNFMEEEDLASLELKLSELSSQFMWMGSNELASDDVDTIIDAFARISGIMMLYTQTQGLGAAIRDLSATIQKEEATFISMASQMSTLCKSFNNDLIAWYKSLFFDGAPSIDFMDASIFSNIQMIRSFLEPVQETEYGDDEGFEFF